MRRNKHFLFGGLGFVGGAVGALVADLVPEGWARSPITHVGYTALWGAIFSAGILVGLTVALEIYAGRKRPSAEKIKSALSAGLLAGALAAGIAQAVFGAYRFEGLGRFIFQSGCWGLAGSILGWRLSRSIPNLGAMRGAVAGLAGGWIGGMGFLLVSSLSAEVVGHLVGIGVLGGALGLAMVIVEAMFREASLEVMWAPREITVLSLGPKPISIGGGDDHIYISGLPPRAATVSLEKCKIYYTDMLTGKKTEFRDGSRIKVGRVEMIVHASK